MVLLAGLETFLLGEILGEHPASFAIGAGAVHRANRAREGLDMMEILTRIIAQRVERQKALGPCLVEGVIEHRAGGDLGVDCGGNRVRHWRLLLCCRADSRSRGCRQDDIPARQPNAGCGRFTLEPLTGEKSCISVSAAWSC